VRKFILTRWQVLLGVAITVAWWWYMELTGASNLLPNDLRLFLFIASWPLLAWFIFWLAIIAIRWLRANQVGAARALVELATFAAMIGVAYFVATLFPHEVKTYSYSDPAWVNATHDAPSATVFAAVLIAEVAMYIAWRVSNTTTNPIDRNP
jgi:hypothetical protein